MLAYQALKAAALHARKARNTQDALTCSTIIGELETVSKRTGEEISDQVVYGKIRKSINTNLDNFNLVRTEADKEKITTENQFLNSLLPQELTEGEVRSILTELAPDNVGDAMKHMNSHFTGRFNGGMASKIAREIIGK